MVRCRGDHSRPLESAACSRDTVRLSARQTHRNNRPAEIPAAATHRSTAALTQPGIGTVRMCPPLPTRSTIAQWSSRLLYMRELQVGQFAAPQTAAKQDGENCPVSFAFERVRVRRLPEFAGPRQW